MQKIINSTSTAPGATLLRKLHEATEPPAAQRASFFAPMFDVRKAAPPLATRLPARLNVAPPTMKAPGEGADFEAGLDLDDPRHVHALQLRQSAVAHSKLLAAIRAQYVGPPTSPSTAPEPL